MGIVSWLNKKKAHLTIVIEGKLQSGKNVFSSQLLLITRMSEPLPSYCETDVWVKIFHKLRLIPADSRSCLVTLFRNKLQFRRALFLSLMFFLFLFLGFSS